jgi:rRNA-processing protein FCF1
MTIGLRSTAVPKDVVEKLRSIELEASNILGKSSTGIFMLSDYLQWATRAVRLIGFDLTTREINRLIATPRHAALQSINPSTYGGSLGEFVSLEVNDRIRELQEARDELLNDYDEWGRGAAMAVVLDTNVMMSFHDKLTMIDWNAKLNARRQIPFILAVTMKVVDELDNLKDRGTGEAKTKARQAVLMLEDVFKYGVRREMLSEAGSPITTNRSSLHIKLIKDEIDHVSLSIADAEIIDRALSIAPYVQSTYVATNDTGMILRARTFGLKAFRITGSDVMPEKV